MITVRCNNCMWVADEGEDGYVSNCPTCSTDEYLMDME